MRVRLVLADLIVDIFLLARGSLIAAVFDIYSFFAHVFQTSLTFRKTPVRVPLTPCYTLKTAAYESPIFADVPAAQHGQFIYSGMHCPKS